MQPAAHAGKAAERRYADARLDADVPGCSERGERVHAVVRSGLRPAQSPERSACQADFERAVAFRRPRFPAAGAPEALDWRPSSHGQHAVQGGIAAIDHEQALPWHGAHEVVELRLNRC